MRVLIILEVDMKKLVLTLGRFLVDFSLFIQIVFVIVLSVFIGWAVYYASPNADFASAIFCGVVAFLILIIMFILSNYLFYLFVGIHDSQESIAKSLEIIAKKYSCNSSAKEDNSLMCPNCHAMYNSGDKFCEECGAKLS